MAYTRSPVFQTVRTPAKVFSPVVPNDGVFLAHVNVFGVDYETPPPPPTPAPPRPFNGFNSRMFNSGTFG
ncbi:hypothetical protein [Tropicimonas sp. S265A]|uniref:hypothetical protein n=1 Tax=Tropicimonas sp. S265A TaxID=3415134 RepID=UPI003C7A0703